jgi:DNA-binding transcriptional ArsR family regulator
MLRNYVGQLIHETRVSRSMTFGDLARAVGAVTPKHISRIARRLVLFEREGVRDRRLLQKVVVALELDVDMVNELLHRQRDEDLADWSRWADERVPMELHVRPFAGFWFRHPLPHDLENDEAGAMEYARLLTVGREEMRVALVVSRRRTVTFARGSIAGVAEASPGRTVMPHMKIGRDRVVFVAGSSRCDER